MNTNMIKYKNNTYEIFFLLNMPLKILSNNNIKMYYIIY